MHDPDEAQAVADVQSERALRRNILAARLRDAKQAVAYWRNVEREVLTELDEVWKEMCQ